MKFSKLTFLLFFAASATCHAQFSCRVLDASGVEIPYVNIYFPTLGTGVLSNSKGVFDLPPGSKLDTGYARFSCLNFETKEVPLRELNARSAASECMVSLKAANYEIAQIEVRESAIKYKERKAGVGAPKWFSRFGYNMSGRGNERGVVIKNNNSCKIKEARVYFNNLRADSVAIELNLYNFANGEVGEKLQHERIFRTVSSEYSNGTYVVNLENDRLFLKNDFLVTVTMLETYNGSVAMIEASSKKKHTGLKRLKDGSWSKTNSCPSIGVTMACRKKGR